MEELTHKQRIIENIKSIYPNAIVSYCLENKWRYIFVMCNIEDRLEIKKILKDSIGQKFFDTLETHRNNNSNKVIIVGKW